MAKRWRKVPDPGPWCFGESWSVIMLIVMHQYQRFYCDCAFRCDTNGTCQRWVIKSHTSAYDCDMKRHWSVYRNDYHVHLIDRLADVVGLIFLALRKCTPNVGRKCKEIRGARMEAGYKRRLRVRAGSEPRDKMTRKHRKRVMLGQEAPREDILTHECRRKQADRPAGRWGWLTRIFDYHFQTPIARGSQHK